MQSNNPKICHALPQACRGKKIYMYVLDTPHKQFANTSDDNDEDQRKMTNLIQTHRSKYKEISIGI